MLKKRDSKQRYWADSRCWGAPTGEDQKWDGKQTYWADGGCWGTPMREDQKWG